MTCKNHADDIKSAFERGYYKGRHEIEQARVELIEKLKPFVAKYDGYDCVLWKIVEARASECLGFAVANRKPDANDKPKTVKPENAKWRCVNCADNHDASESLGANEAATQLDSSRRANALLKPKPPRPEYKERYSAIVKERPGTKEEIEKLPEVEPETEEVT